VPRTPRVLVLAALLVSVVAAPGSAAAEEKIDYADGPTACRAFHERNERELAEWSKTQPATPYVYRRDDNVLGAPWGPVTGGLGASYDLVLASLIPHVGAQLRTETPAVVVSWPWQIPFGPAYTCSRQRGGFTVRDFRYHRFILEPGFVAGNRGSGFFTRVGYRFIYHPSDWVVGAGGGLGSTMELSKGEPGRASLGPEAVMQFGHCCDSAYFTFAVRYDRFFAGNQLDVLWGSLGFTFF